TRAVQSAITPPSVQYPRRRRKRRRQQPVALGIISLPPGSGKEDEVSGSGFRPFGERMAFLSRGVDQGGFAEGDGAHRQRLAFSSGLGDRPWPCLLATSGGDRRPVWDGHAKARADWWSRLSGALTLIRTSTTAVTPASRSAGRVPSTGGPCRAGPRAPGA